MTVRLADGVCDAKLRSNGISKVEYLALQWDDLQEFRTRYNYRPDLKSQP